MRPIPAFFAAGLLLAGLGQTRPATRPALDKARRDKAQWCLDQARTALRGRTSPLVLELDARLGNDAAALAAAQAIGDADERILALAGIARARAAAGDAAGARQVLMEFRKDIPPAPAPAAPPAGRGKPAASMPSGPRSERLATLAAAQAASGDIAGARQTAGEIGAPADLVQAWEEIADAQLKARDLAGAKGSLVLAAKALQAQGDATPLGWIDLCERLAAAGDVASARRVAAQRLKAPLQAASALAAIGREQASHNDIPTARATLLDAQRQAAAKVSDEDAPGRPRVLREIADGYIEARDFKVARDMLAAARKQAEAIDPARDIRPEILLKISLSQHEAGDPAFRDTRDSAFKAAKALPDAGTSAHALWQMARVLAREGESYGAVDALKSAQGAASIDPVATSALAQAIAHDAAWTEGPPVDLSWIAGLPAESQPLAYATAGLGLLEPGDAPAIARLRRLSLAGDAESMRELAYACQEGYGTDKNYAQAMNWYLKAAEHGNALAMTNVGILYHNGSGVAHDEVQAMAWFRKGADAGDKLGMWFLARGYRDGRAGKPDYVQAMKWFEKAAAAGDASSMRGLAELYEKGQGAPADPAKARTWYEKAAAAGDSDSRDWLAKHPR